MAEIIRIICRLGHTSILMVYISMSYCFRLLMCHIIHVAFKCFGVDACRTWTSIDLVLDPPGRQTIPAIFENYLGFLQWMSAHVDSSRSSRQVASKKRKTIPVIFGTVAAFLEQIPPTPAVECPGLYTEEEGAWEVEGGGPRLVPSRTGGGKRPLKEPLRKSVRPEAWLRSVS